MKIKSLSIIIFCFLVINSFIVVFLDEKCEASGNKIYVDDKPNLYTDGSAEYPYNSIQHAIDVASNGDTIYVFGGEYNETLRIDKEITLIGSIEGGNSIIFYGKSHKYTIEITADYVNFTGFDINDDRNRHDYYITGALIHVTSNSVIIQNNNIKNCKNDWGIFLDSSDNNLIKDNEIDNVKVGIYGYSSITNDIIENTISNCSFSAVEIQSSDHNTLYNNALFNNHYAIYGKECNELNISNNSIHTNSLRGIGLFDCNVNNIIKNNVVYECSGDGIYLSSDNCEVIGNTVRDNQIGIGLEKSYCTIKSNFIKDSSSIGLYAYSESKDNTIYLNHFNKNNINAIELGKNKWYYDNQGNYWDDYNEIDIEPNGTGDGIGDTFYTKGGITDKYPLGVFLKPPNKPSNPSPSDGEDDVGLIITLNVDVYDPDGAMMDVYFYSLINVSTTNEIVYKSDLLDVVENVESGGTASCSFKLPFDKVFSWYVDVTDGKLSNQSDIWFFTTRKTPGDNDPPVAIINIEEQIDETITFNALSSYDPDGTIGFYRWNFDDYTSEILSGRPTHSYSKDGDYIVTLTVIDNDGTSDMDTFKVIIGKGSPTTPLNANHGGPYEGYNAGTAIPFSGSATGGTSHYTYQWDFGDGSTGTGKKINHTYQNDGKYTVTLTVKDSNGNTDHAEVNVTIKSSVPSSSSEDSPGFEIILVVTVIFLILLYRRRFRKR